MRISSAVVLILLGAACASNPKPTAGPASCVVPGATYEIHTEEVSGDCGPVHDDLVNVSNDGSSEHNAEVGCVLGSDDHLDGCTSYLDRVCQIGDGLSVTVHGKSTFDAKGHGSALQSLVYTKDGQVICSSNYRLTYTPL